MRGRYGIYATIRQGMPEALLEDGRCKEGFFPRAFRGPVDLDLGLLAFRILGEYIFTKWPSLWSFVTAALEANTGSMVAAILNCKHFTILYICTFYNLQVCHQHTVTSQVYVNFSKGCQMLVDCKSQDWPMMSQDDRQQTRQHGGKGEIAFSANDLFSSDCVVMQ